MHIESSLKEIYDEQKRNFERDRELGRTLREMNMAIKYGEDCEWKWRTFLNGHYCPFKIKESTFCLFWTFIFFKINLQQNEIVDR